MTLGENTSETPTSNPTPTPPSPRSAEAIEVIVALRVATALAQRWMNANEELVQSPDNSHSCNKRKYKNEKTENSRQHLQRKRYVGTLPECDKCEYHHQGACGRFFCRNCKREGHSARFCRNQMQETVTAFAATAAAPTSDNTTNPKPYLGKYPKCDKCILHHHGECKTMICQLCNNKGHTARFCKDPNQKPKQPTNQEATPTCYECGEAGHFRRNCPKAEGQARH